MTTAPIEWSYNPWRDRPGRAAVALVAALACCVCATSLGLAVVPTLILCVVCVATLAAGFLPVRCRLDDEGVARGSGWLRERRPWTRVHRAERQRDGVWLSPYRHRHWLDPWRAWFLPYPHRAAPATEALEEILSRHGL
jgi:hypothetical protein